MNSCIICPFCDHGRKAFKGNISLARVTNSFIGNTGELAMTSSSRWGQTSESKSSMFGVPRSVLFILFTLGDKQTGLQILTHVEGRIRDKAYRKEKGAACLQSSFKGTRFQQNWLINTRTQVSGGTPPKRNLFIKLCTYLLILTYLNLSHLQNTLHLMQHNHQNFSHCLKQFLNLLILMAFSASAIFCFNYSTSAKHFPLRIFSSRET